MALDFRGIAASSGSACTSGSLEPSHVLRAIGVPPELARGTVRLSLGRMTTEEQVEYLIAALGEVVEQLRH
jgi:cysteine desulfurase